MNTETSKFDHETYRRWSRCQRKVRHRTERDAEKAIERMRQRELMDDALKVYFCEYCGGYHVGNDG